MKETYAEDIATAKELIEEFGQSCWWQLAPEAVGGTPGYPGEAAPGDPVPCEIAFFSPKDLDRGVQEYLSPMPGTEVLDSAQIGLLAGGLSFVPSPLDTIRRGAVDAEPISILSIDLLAPNGTPVLYFVRVAE